jgi:hypothetical protein
MLNPNSITAKIAEPAPFCITAFNEPITAPLHRKLVSVHRAPHLLCSRAFEVRTVRLYARYRASAAPCKHLQISDLQKIETFAPVNGYENCNDGEMLYIVPV